MKACLMRASNCSFSVALLLTYSANTLAAGFELPQRGIKEMGIAYGGSAALLEDASAIGNNPAGLMRLQGRNLTGAVTLISSGFDYDLEVHRELIPGVDGQVPGKSRGSISGMSVAPHLYYSRRLSENSAMGFGIYAPFGSHTDYGDDWAGRYHATSTEFRAVNLNPVFAWRESDRLSFGVGAVIQVFTGEFKSKIDLGYLVADQLIKQVADTSGPFGVDVRLRPGGDALIGGAYPACPAGNTGEQCAARILSHDFDVDNTMTVSGLGYGINVGALWEHSERTRAGFNYNSRVRHIATGDARRPQTLDPAFRQRLEDAIGSLKLQANILGIWTNVGDIASQQPASAVDGANKAVGPLGAAGGDIELIITMPDVATLSGFHQLNDNWAITGGVTWTKWSYVRELRFSYTDDSDRGGSDLGGEGNDVRRRDLVVPFDWKDTFRFGAGGIYSGFDRWKLYAGAAFDESPIPNAARRTARGPDSDRIIVSVGASWQLNRQFDLDMGFAHTVFTESRIDNAENPAGTYHRMEGSYKGGLNTVSAQLNYSF